MIHVEFSLIQDTCWIDVEVTIINLQKEEPSVQCTKSIFFCFHKINMRSFVSINCDYSSFFYQFKTIIKKI